LHKGKEFDSVVLHEVVPQALLQWLSSQRKTSFDKGPTGDGMHVLIKNEFDSRI
jgi:hypothetical protein